MDRGRLEGCETSAIMTRVLYTIRRDFSDALMGCCVDYCYAAGVIAANSVGLIEGYILQRIFNNKYFGENTYKTQLNNYI